MCIHREGKFEKKDIDSSIVSKFFMENKNNLYSVKFNWRGEPTLNTKLPVYVMLAKQTGTKEVQINTNGILVDSQLSERLITSGLDRIIFSVDGISPETYESVRKSSEYDVLIKNIFQLINNKFRKKIKKPFIRVQMCYDKQKEKESKLFVDFWRNKGVQISLIEMQDRKNKTVEGIKRYFCEQPFQRLTINCNGDVFPCCADWEESMKLGNISKDSLYSMWHGKQIENMRSCFLRGDVSELESCKKCPKLKEK
jgi:radical SAM protein with 4Fe4S-binding SPASM domain